VDPVGVRDDEQKQERRERRSVYPARTSAIVIASRVGTTKIETCQLTV